MSNSKMTKRALLTSIMALMLCFAMLTGTTFAWFTDQETSANNRIVAGNLDVDFLMYNGSAYASIAGGVGDIFSEGATANASNATLWEPGATHVAYLAVENAGSLALKYNIALNITDNGLADALEFIIVDEFKYEGTAVSDWATLKTTYTPGVLVDNDADGKINLIAAPNGKLVPETTDYFALVVHMREDAGNEFMGKDIVIDVIVQATQLESEEDAFGSEYDEPAEFAYFGTGATTVDKTSAATAYEVESRNSSGAKVASATVPADAIDDAAGSIALDVEETAVNQNISVATGHAIKSFEIKLDGLKAGNTTGITVDLRLETGLDPATVKLYHYDTEILCNYNPTTGYVQFTVTTFSPFSVTFDPESEFEAPAVDASKLPTATVTPYTDTQNIEWGNYGQWSPTNGLEANLEAAYTFACTETYEQAKENPYAYWYCDFYVKLNEDLGANEIFLGGNYGSFGWVGFHNGDLTLDANTEIGLLESVTTNPWTYLDVVQNVGKFICGVGDVNNALAGATFTVMLRLTNPENANDFVNVATINHTFAGAVVAE